MAPPHLSLACQTPSDGPGAEPVDGLSDVGLVICIQRRRPSALAEVCRRHGGALHVHTASVCGLERAEPVVAEVLIELWWQPQLFDPAASSLRAFLLSRAHIRAVAVARARRAEPSPLPDPTELLDQGGAADHATRVLSCLPEAERHAIALAYLGGYRCAEIAEAVGEPEPVVARRMRSGLQLLGTRPAPRGVRR